MGERAPLLDAIRSAPADDLPRLVYADWLDEFCHDDVDRATAEFIRTSCNGKIQQRIPRSASGWIKNNWLRLFPKWAERNSRTEMAPDATKFIGSVIRSKVYVPEYDTKTKRLACVELKLQRGFMTDCLIYTPKFKVILEPEIAAFHPLAKIIDIDEYQALLLESEAQAELRRR